MRDNGCALLVSLLLEDFCFASTASGFRVGDLIVVICFDKIK